MNATLMGELRDAKRLMVESQSRYAFAVEAALKPGLRIHFVFGNGKRAAIVRYVMRNGANTRVVVESANPKHTAGEVCVYRIDPTKILALSIAEANEEGTV